MLPVQPVRSVKRMGIFVGGAGQPVSDQVHSTRLPDWNLERGRVGESRKVAVEVIVNGVSVARESIVADGAMYDFKATVTVTRSS